MAKQVDIKKVDFVDDPLIEEVDHGGMPNIVQEIGGANFYLRPCGLFTVMAANDPDGSSVGVIIMASNIGGENRGHYLEISAQDARNIGNQFIRMADEIEAPGTHKKHRAPGSGTVN